ARPWGRARVSACEPNHSRWRGFGCSVRLGGPMRLSRLLSITVVVGAASAAMVVACGSDPAKPDSKVWKDAPPMPDAMVNNVGKLCGSNADCAPGGSCITLRTGSGSGAMTGHPYCSQACVQGSGDTCAVGSTGTGFP